MKYASIDIGTNTLRLLVADGLADGNIRPLAYRRAITRLGGRYSEGCIDKYAAERTFNAILEFKKVMDEYRVEKTIAVATSVVRRAKNKDWFVSEVTKRTGIGVSVISGDEEGRLSLLGVMTVVGGEKDRLIMDIGGGSTEFILARGAVISGIWSMEMGVVHLAENFLKSDPPADCEIERMDREIRAVIRNLKKTMKGSGIAVEEYSERNGAEIVGTAGTITTLAAMDQDITEYDRGRINNYILSIDRMRAIWNNLVRLTLKERERILTLEKGREDLIIPGSLIALAAMDSFGFSSMRVSDAGLLEGVILNELRLT
ncbi:MAG: Ppx/GppA family phosphatase [Deltaproteobacteria bacterium]|nr:Ppx/GppA family phosphatase [Deltaproteobacteria bacterium]